MVQTTETRTHPTPIIATNFGASGVARSITHPNGSFLLTTRKYIHTHATDPTYANAPTMPSLSGVGFMSTYYAAGTIDEIRRYHSLSICEPGQLRKYVDTNKTASGREAHEVSAS
jgi:hypothetical protein